MIDWNLAPKSANELVRNGFRIAYRDDAGNVYMSTGWEYIESWGLAEVMATRPTQKTVADAVAALSKEELTGEWEQVRYAPKQDYFFPGMNRDKWVDSVHVCTRAEFEAYMKERESEKWTHTWKGDKCYVVHIDGCAAWVVLQNAGGKTIPTNSLKPIKPTISESEMMQRIKYRAISVDYDDEFGAKVRSWLEQYNII